MLKFGSRGDSNIVYKCTVKLLEDTEILECEYKPHHKGKYLLEYVCQQLNLVEQDYLGLRYVDPTEQRHWLDLAKSICKQVKDLDPVIFSFRVKFYPPDPFRLKEEITRYQIYLQLKRDLLHGRLYCGANEAATLAALIIQGDLGDYDPDIHMGNYISDYKILLKQTPAIEEKAMEIHQKQLKGHSASQCENTFLKLACQMDTYGVDPHPVKDHKGSQLYLGINYSGILTFQGSRKTHHFRWPDIQKINYEGKMFIIHLNYNEKKHTVGFKCPTGAACRHVWRCAIEQMLFFTLPTSSDAPSVVTGGGLFSWGTKFRYTGRTEREILDDASAALLHGDDQSGSASSAHPRRKASSVPATPSTPLQPHLGYGYGAPPPRSCHSDAGGGGTAPAQHHHHHQRTMETSSSVGLLAGLAYGGGEAGELETVAEERGRNAAVAAREEAAERFSDYCFRDSFEHSSSESQLLDGGYRGCETTDPSHRSSRSQTPLSHSHMDSRLCLPNSSSVVGRQKSPRKNRKFSIVKTFVPTFVAVTVVTLILTVVVLETDVGFLGRIRNIPEIVSLKYHFYEPIKQYIKKKFLEFFQKS